MQASLVCMMTYDHIAQWYKFSAWYQYPISDHFNPVMLESLPVGPRFDASALTGFFVEGGASPMAVGSVGTLQLSTS